MTRALVVGHGSIGRRHVGVLRELGCDVGVVSQRPVEGSPGFADVSQALTIWRPEYVVVANRTSEHRGTLERLAAQQFDGRVLVEKPLFDCVAPIPAHRFSLSAVAYNLRCHPLLRRLKSALDDGRGLVTASVYVGSYLPEWRPGTDYRQSYSASREHGGGVLRDLSHELDYAAWLFGPWRRLTATGGRLGQLEIDSDDAYTLLMETTRCRLVSLHMNYLDRCPRREILVNAGDHTIRVDLINGILSIDGVEEHAAVARDDTYRAEHQLMLAGTADGLCTMDEGLETLATIASAEQAATSHTWIAR